MKTWILCVDPLGAKLYEREGAGEPVRFSHQIPYPQRSVSAGTVPPKDDFIRFIAENTDQALGMDGQSGLILCGEPPLLTQVQEHLAARSRQHIIGSIRHNLCHVSDDQLTAQSQKFM